jgi:glucose-6-phosphate dehydrogenase assembly protein OpcA
MTIDLTATTAADISEALARERRRAGSAALGLVLTLIIATEERDHYDALRAATTAAAEHPCRILCVIPRGPKASAQLDAEVRGGAAGEVVVLRLHGHLGDHADSVVLPLLLPDTPVVAYWPGAAPDVPGDTPLGALAQRRVTDAAAAARPLAALALRRDGLRDGDTDLAWTRTTSWRALLAAALDQPFDTITSASVAAQRGNPSAALLAAWLRVRLGVEVTERTSRGPGVTEARIETVRGAITVARPDGHRATLTRDGHPDRNVALARRDTAELLAEELRRLDHDEPYAETLAAIGASGSAPAQRKAATKKRATAAKKKARA